MKTDMGCKVHELKPGTEFSFDGGRTWVTVKAIKYVESSPYMESDDMTIWVQPATWCCLTAFMSCSQRCKSSMI